MSKKLLCASILLTSGFSLVAVDAVFNRLDSGAHQVYWADAANWKDAATGETLAEPPTNECDNVSFVQPNSNVYLQKIGVGSGESSSHGMGFTVNSVIGSRFHKICHTFKWTEGIVAKRHVLTVNNPNGFTGLWYSGDAGAVFRFPATSSFTPGISTLSANARPSVDIPAAGTKAHLGSLYNSGAMTKCGEGELVLGGAKGADVRLYVEKGTLTLEGRQEGETQDKVLAKAAFHLDATDRASLVVSDDGADGRSLISKWMDVRGGMEAYKPQSVSRLALVNNPFLVDVDGMDMVDFGSAFADQESVALWGPTNCLLKFAEMNNVREVFYVARYHKKPKFNAVLGDNNAPTLQPADCLLGGSANIGARTGDIYADGLRIDGKWWPDSGNGLTNLHVIAIGSEVNLEFSTIGSDQEFSDRTGGMMIGEIILYTNALTRVERMRVHQYLCDKWLRKTPTLGVDAGQVFLQDTENSAVGVPENRTAKIVDLLASPDGKIVKKGGGTLEVDTVYPSNAVFEVEGGNVRIARSVAEPSGTAPAADPVVWLDANAATSLETSGAGGDGGAEVSRWTDRRGGEGAISAIASDVRPTLAKAASVTGLDAMDFGSTSATSSYFKFPWWGNKSARFKAGFAVVRPINSDKTYVPYFGSIDMTFMREGDKGGSHRRFISEKYTYPALGAALWTLDGVPQDPIVFNKELANTATFKVVAFSLGEKVLVDAIAFARNSANYCGGVQIGEFLLYDRELTDGERRQTEAYLMKRWLGADHPSEVRPSPSFVFGENVDAVLDSDCDASVVSVSGGTGKLEKKGSGAVVLSSGLSAEEASSLTVHEGALHIPFVKTFMDEALFHFDASKDDSLVYATDESGNEYLSEWLDVRGNGVKATTVLKDAAGHVKGAPVPVEREVRDGVTRKMLGFGGVLSGTAAAMFMNKNFANVREAHAIHQDISKNSMYFSHSHLNPAAAPNTSQYHDFYRATDGSYFGSSAASSLKNGYIATNGAPVASYTDMVPQEATLFSMAATEAKLHVNSIQYDRTVPGGAYVGEQLAFSRVLTETEREYLQRYLMWKWFGEGEKPVLPGLCFEAFNVSHRAALNLPGNASLSVKALSGTGSVSGGELSEVTSLSADVADVAGFRHMSVDAKVDFAQELCVKLSGDGTLLDEGEYAILSVRALGEMPSSLKIDASGVTRTKLYSLAFSGNRLVLKVRPKGLRLIVK